MKARAAKASALDRLLQLPGLKQSGKNQYLAQCPAHDDGNASLSFNVDAKGVIGVTCHVGCKAPAICKALGLSTKDLFPSGVPAQKALKPIAKPARVALVRALSAAEIEEARQAAKKLGPSSFDSYKLTSVYPYRLATGKVWSYRARFDGKGGDKQIFPFHHNGNDWIKSEPSAPRAGKPLYHLPEVLATTGPVLIVEGEKCADALAFLKLAATTSGAAKSASKADWKPLAGRQCIIWPDNDDPGDAYAADVAARLLALGCDVAVIDVEALGLPNAGDDAADWLAANAKASAADVLNLPTIAPQTTESVSVQLVCAADIEPQAIEWIWEGWLAKGMLHIVAGDGGTGKTTAMLTIAAAISSGGELPDGSTAPKGNVLIWTGEDDIPRVIVPRLKAAGADLRNVFIVKGAHDDEGARPFDPATDMRDLEAQALRIGNVAMVLVDPIVNAVAGDSHKNSDVRRGLQPLVDLGSKVGAAIVGITHFAKNTESKNTADRIIGSVAYKNFARLAMVAVKGKDGDCRLVRCKSNIGPDGDGFAYRIEIVQREYDGGVNAVSKIEWGEPLFGFAKGLLDQLEGKRTARDEAADWLYSTLSAGPVSSKDLKAKAAEDGIAWRTVERAKNELTVDAKRLQVKGKARGEGEWIWALPATGREAAEVGRRQAKYSG